nr:MAG TPA: hypothetical protein [Caudoviricetes sp.]
MLFLVLQSAPIAHRFMFFSMFYLERYVWEKFIFFGERYKLHSTVSRGYGLKMVMLSVSVFCQKLLFTFLASFIFAFVFLVWCPYGFEEIFWFLFLFYK